MSSDVRIEKDSLGEVRIPAGAYWGTTTQRAIDSYPISGLRAHPKFVDAYIYLKKAAAMANRDAGVVKPELANAIIAACDDVLAGKLRDQFPVDVFQMGAGTSFHMNVNEVLASRANEILGHKVGTPGGPVTANDHVNFGQSTNDTFPTAIRLAIQLLERDHLRQPLHDFQAALAEKGRAFDGILKSARTHLQDAVPIRLGQEFAAYAKAMQRCAEAIEYSRHRAAELGIGGSAAGTGLNTAPGYADKLVANLRDIMGIPDLRTSDDLCEAMQSQRPVAEVSAALRNLALEVSRICNDLRMLCSGPTTGLDEIRLPAIAPGSSIMPGKINPSMAEMANMVCFQVIGNDTAVSWAVGGGQLELNVMMPLMAHNINTSFHIMGAMLRQMTDLCIKGLTANDDRCRMYLERTLGLATALNTYIGYKNAAEVVKEAGKTGKTIMEVVREKKLLSEEDMARVMEPRQMTSPGIPGAGGG